MDGITFLNKEEILEGPPSASIVSFYLGENQMNNNIRLCNY